MPRDGGNARADTDARALRLLDVALQRPEGDRREWLSAQCGEDAALREAVLALLDACERADDHRFLADSVEALGTGVVQSVLAQEEARASDTVAIVAAALDGRYTFVRKLGAGGAASVHLARDLRHDRDVAIKIIQQPFGGTHQRERFRKEIAIEARLRHPYIVPVLDSGEASGIPYYVMPFIDGESLHERLERHGALPLDEVLAVARDVAEALDCAHRHGVIHRDVKPRNILLLQGHALVADFGIALALQLPNDSRVTSQGMAVGTPAYMSPEQALAAGQVDARSDVYALGCVVYEMLTGEVPYPGSTPQAIVAKHISAPIPDVAVLRPQLPPRVCDAVRTALAKHPADRFASAGAFVRALQAGAEQETAERPVPPGAMHPPAPRGRPASSRDTPPVPRPAPAAGDGADRRLTRFTIAAALALIVAVALLGARLRASRAASAIVADTTRYVVLALHREHSTVRDLTPQVHDAAARWAGVRVLDAEPTDASIGAGAAEGALAASRRAASHGAGRFFWGSVHHSGDSLRVHLRLSDVAGRGVVLAERAVHLPAAASSADTLLRHVVDALLLRHVGEYASVPDGGTRSLPAHQSFDAASRHLAAWRLDSVVAALERATALDARFARAHLWLAVTRAWRGLEPARFRLSAEQATLRRADLGSREQVLAQAILAEGTGALGEACARWRAYAALDSNDFTGWYGAARCDRNDTRVVRDRRSPSGWRFRSSIQASLRAYQRAFRLHPAILSSLSDRGFEPLRRLLFGISYLRSGYSEGPDSTYFLARIALDGDTLRFTPYPSATHALFLPQDEALARALHYQDEILHEIAAGWVSSHPQSADARHALALSLARLGDGTALDTLATARRLALTPGERLRTSLASVWMPLAFGIARGDEGALRRVRALADSLLAREDPATTGDPLQLSAVAALVGRPGVAARFARRGEVGRELGAPPPIAGDAAALLVFAAAGGPLDSIQALAARVQREIDQLPDASERLTLRLSFIVRAATLCFPACRLPQAAPMRGKGNELFDMQLAHAAGDVVTARRMFDALEAVRRDIPPERVTWDGLAPEAQLLLDMGEPQRLANWLTRPMERLHRSSLHALATPVGAASLLRAVQLRAAAAERLDDAVEATRWSRVVEILRGRGGGRGR